ncbi:MAG: alpha/beta fold hydrolase [Pigmentiphaga sp.]|uniref:alpha/beta fold hydrolase n=1 Tax=Pigmentiphaga sp. TaxID=1977564 RepID=UPI0029BDDC40|nr:alpha/beta fold hydrolase [Pigmentiphaga sp.]MDX3906299.1 alpha/beta fold hydrolase [Pigmentiphaga sp.]
MSRHALEKFLFRFDKEPALQAALQAGTDAVFQGYELEEHERRVLRERDLATLYEWGVHPLLIRNFAGTLGLNYVQAYRARGLGPRPCFRKGDIDMKETEIRSRWVLANGVRTHYAETGNDGKTLVALHGGGAGSSGASGMGLVMPLLGRDFRVVAPDSIGGFGLTDPSAPTPYGLISRAAHTADFVDAIGLEKFSVLGNSQGAWAGVYYAMLHPDRVEKLIIVSSLTIATSMGIKQEPNEAMRALMGYDGTREGMKRLLEALIIDKSRITDQLIDERQRAATRLGAFEAFQRMAQGIEFVRNDPVLKLQTQWREALPALTRRIPTLILWGKNDTFAVPASGQALADMLPDARIEWIEGAGHQVQTDAPDRCADIIRSFLND